MAQPATFSDSTSAIQACLHRRSVPASSGLAEPVLGEHGLRRRPTARSRRTSAPSPRSRWQRSVRSDRGSAFASARSSATLTLSGMTRGVGAVDEAGVDLAARHVVECLAHGCGADHLRLDRGPQPAPPRARPWYSGRPARWPAAPIAMRLTLAYVRSPSGFGTLLAVCRHDHDQRVGDEVAPLRGLHQPLLLRPGPSSPGRRSANTSTGRALGDLLQQRAGGAEVEQHLGARVGGLEHRAEVLERIGQARRRRDGQIGCVRRHRGDGQQEQAQAAAPGGGAQQRAVLHARTGLVNCAMYDYIRREHPARARVIPVCVVVPAFRSVYAIYLALSRCGGSRPRDVPTDPSPWARA